MSKKIKFASVTYKGPKEDYKKVVQLSKFILNGYIELKNADCVFDELTQILKKETLDFEEEVQWAEQRSEYFKNRENWKKIVKKMEKDPIWKEAYRLAMEAYHQLYEMN